MEKYQYNKLIMYIFIFCEKRNKIKYYDIIWLEMIINKNIYQYFVYKAFMFFFHIYFINIKKILSFLFCIFLNKNYKCVYGNLHCFEDNIFLLFILIIIIL